MKGELEAEGAAKPAPAPAALGLDGLCDALSVVIGRLDLVLVSMGALKAESMSMSAHVIRRRDLRKKCLRHVIDTLHTIDLPFPEDLLPEIDAIAERVDMLEAAAKKGDKKGGRKGGKGC